MRSSGESNCCWSLGMRRAGGCRSCCARGVPTPWARDKLTARIWTLGMLKPAASASQRAISKQANIWSLCSPAWTRKSMRAVQELNWRSSS
eukprot:3148619-Pyramimonas_sp.AAC.1